MTKIPAEIFALITAGCLASIQIRRVIKGELPLFGLRHFSAASRITLDAFDRAMIVAAALPFAAFLWRMILQ